MDTFKSYCNQLRKQINKAGVSFYHSYFGPNLDYTKMLCKKLSSIKQLTRSSDTIDRLHINCPVTSSAPENTFNYFFLYVASKNYNNCACDYITYNNSQSLFFLIQLQNRKHILYLWAWIVILALMLTTYKFFIVCISYLCLSKAIFP